MKRTIMSQEFDRQILRVLGKRAKPKSATEITLLLTPLVFDLSIQKVKAHLQYLIQQGEIKKEYAFGRAFYSRTNMYERIQAL